nr:MAG TPA: hypothetical protein [Caudoviricetes sp.]
MNTSSKLNFTIIIHYKVMGTCSQISLYVFVAPYFIAIQSTANLLTCLRLFKFWLRFRRLWLWSLWLYSSWLRLICIIFRLLLVIICIIFRLLFCIILFILDW